MAPFFKREADSRPLIFGGGQNKVDKQTVSRQSPRQE